MGVGPSAHSYNGNSRQWNILSNKKYIEGINSGNKCFEREELNNKQLYNEYIFTHIRTIWGVNLDDIKTHFGLTAQKAFKKDISSWIYQEKIKEEKNIFTLTNSGKIYADTIASSLFIV